MAALRGERREGGLEELNLAVKWIKFLTRKFSVVFLIYTFVNS